MKKFFTLMLLAVGVDLLLAVPVMLLWNYMVVPTFTLPALTYGKSLALLFLVSLLSSNFTLIEEL
jgi:hypothetical protein